MFYLRVSMFVTGLLLLVPHALAQSSISVDWTMLADPAAQQFDDPYRDLTPSQFQSLMDLARLQIALSGELPAGERAEFEERALILSRRLQAQGLDPEWILGQREIVAERRQKAAIATNSVLDGESIELTGYLLVAPDIQNDAMVAYLLPDRGVCMHLPPPVPNQLVRLDIDQVPDPLGACIAASVRGRLSADETNATVPVFDDTVHLWSRWRLDMVEVITSGSLSVEGSRSLGKSNEGTADDET